MSLLALQTVLSNNFVSICLILLQHVKRLSHLKIIQTKQQSCPSGSWKTNLVAEGTTGVHVTFVFIGYHLNSRMDARYVYLPQDFWCSNNKLVHFFVPSMKTRHNQQREYPVKRDKFKEQCFDRLLKKSVWTMLHWSASIRWSLREEKQNRYINRAL
jgi:hypothetical protein